MLLPNDFVVRATDAYTDDDQEPEVTEEDLMMDARREAYYAEIWESAFGDLGNHIDDEP
jgi:hypothetical protein